MSITTTFQPEEASERFNDPFEQVPTYLFRTYAPRSNGTHNGKIFASAAFTYGSGLASTDIFEHPVEHGADMLRNHLLWKNRRDDNLVSWTNSFIFAVQHAIYHLETDYGKPSEKDIRVCVLNTRKLPRQAFLPAMWLLGELQVEDEEIKQKRWMYHGEFLSQGQIDVANLDSSYIINTNLATLFKHGLGALYSAFTEAGQRGFLVSRVRELRQTFTSGDSAETPCAKTPSDDELRLANVIADHLTDDAWMRVVMAVTLLSLRRRIRLDRKTLNSFRERRTTDGFYKRNVDSYGTTSLDVPEHFQYVALLHDVLADGLRHDWKLKHQQVQSSTALEDAMGNMNLSRDPTPG